MRHPHGDKKSRDIWLLSRHHKMLDLLLVQRKVTKIVQFVDHASQLSILTFSEVSYTYSFSFMDHIQTISDLSE